MGLWADHLQLAKEKAKVVSVAPSAEGLWASRLPVPAAGLGPSTAASNPRAGFRDLQRQKIGQRGRALWPFNFRIDLQAEPVVSVLFGLRAALLPGEWEQLEEEPCVPSCHRARKGAGSGRVCTVTTAATIAPVHTAS